MPLQNRETPLSELSSCEPVLELDIDHWPMLSRTSVLVGVLDRLASRAEATAPA